jgi:hypothetical protein
MGRALGIGVLFDNRPDGSVAETLPFNLSEFPALQYRTKRPVILHPDRNGNDPDASSLPFQICKIPPAFPLLDGLDFNSASSVRRWAHPTNSARMT